MRNWICQLLPAESRFFFFFFLYARSHSTEATHCLGLVVCIDKWRQQINVKRHVNHHPLTLQLHPGAAGHQSRFMLFFFSLPLSRFQFDSSPPCRSSSTRWWRSSHQGAASRQHQPHTDTQRRRRKKTICWLAVSSLFFLVCHFYTLHSQHIQVCVEVLLLVWQNVLIVIIWLK